MVLKLLLILFSSVFLSGCSLAPKKSGLEVMSYPPAKVFVNNKEMGMTPYKNINLKPGMVEVKLQTNDKQWTKKVELQNHINTVINWEFGKEDKYSGGYVLFLEKTGDDKKAGLMVNILPDKSAVSIDNEIKGFSPIRINDIGDGDRQLTLSYPGYKSLNVYVKAIKGYQLIIDANLSKEEVVVNETQPITTPTPTIGLKNSVIIKETETGWLRVRDKASSGGVEIAKVKPDEKYEIMEELDEWYKIDLGNGKSGWISTKYASKVQ